MNDIIQANELLITKFTSIKDWDKTQDEVFQML